ncbi:hypothetical protein L1281_000089 [Neisseria sp. HSC-16F19]|nr:DUF6630 family protein [Neisseria sp. HSC-16F19]MCP2039524.1 hypothetical protein [Neisseria sp. HSC-16F19]
MSKPNFFQRLTQAFRPPQSSAPADTALAQLAVLLTPAAAQADVLAEIRLADTEPHAYFSRFEDALCQRGIEEAAEVSPWLALVDALERCGVLTECDWKIDGEELAHRLQKLMKRHHCNPDDSRLQALAAQKLAPIGTFAPAIRTLLASHDLTLAFLDIDSDSYPLVLLPDTQLAAAQQLAAQCRKRIIVLTENT